MRSCICGLLATPSHSSIPASAWISDTHIIADGYRGSYRLMGNEQLWGWRERNHCNSVPVTEPRPFLGAVRDLGGHKVSAPSRDRVKCVESGKSFGSAKGCLSRGR